MTLYLGSESQNILTVLQQRNLAQPLNKALCMIVMIAWLCEVWIIITWFRVLVRIPKIVTIDVTEYYFFSQLNAVMTTKGLEVTTRFMNTSWSIVVLVKWKKGELSLEFCGDKDVLIGGDLFSHRPIKKLICLSCNIRNTIQIKHDSNVFFIFHSPIDLILVPTYPLIIIFSSSRQVCGRCVY
jgi:hypothetical protein